MITRLGMRMLLAAVVALLALPSLLPAAVISVNDTKWGAGSITRDLTNNLDWLDWTLATNRSFLDISSKMGPGQEFDGWRYANANDFMNLFLSAGINPALINPPISSVLPADAAMQTLASYLGMTYPSASITRATSSQYTGPFMLGSGELWLLPVQGPETDPAGAYTPGHMSSINETYAHPGHGNALVRAAPEPATLALVALGGLALLRRKAR